MIPNNAFTPTPVTGTFLYLQDVLYPPLTQTVMGGISLNNPSKGLLYQPWTIAYDGANIQVAPATFTEIFTLAATGVTSVSLAFDINMSLVIAWTTLSGANLYYYDTITSGYVTQYFADVTSCRVCIDNPQAYYAGSADVIFGYTLAGNLCYRQQRDRYNIEYIISPTTQLLTRMGPSSANRLQFETSELL